MKKYAKSFEQFSSKRGETVNHTINHSFFLVHLLLYMGFVRRGFLVLMIGCVISWYSSCLSLTQGATIGQLRGYKYSDQIIFNSFKLERRNCYLFSLCKLVIAWRFLIFIILMVPVMSFLWQFSCLSLA